MRDEDGEAAAADAAPLRPPGLMPASDPNVRHDDDRRLDAQHADAQHADARRHGAESAAEEAPDSPLPWLLGGVVILALIAGVVWLLLTTLGVIATGTPTPDQATPHDPLADLLEDVGLASDDGVGGVLLRVVNAIFGQPGERAERVVTLSAGAAGFSLLWKFALWPLYHRLSHERIRQHPVRRAMLAMLQDEPGAHQAIIAQRLSLASGQVRHHLTTLTRHRLVGSWQDGGLRRYFLSGTMPAEAARQAGALRRPHAQAVYDLLSTEPHLTLRAAGARLGVSAPTVLRIKRQLESQGLLSARHARPRHTDADA